MVKSHTETVQVISIGEDQIAFKVSYEDEPVEGAIVSINQMITAPMLRTKTTYETGTAIFDVRDMYPPIISDPCAVLESKPWLVIAFVNDSPFAMYGELDLSCGDVYDVTLEKHVEVPTFYLDFYLRDSIGRDLFGTLVTSLETFLLGWQGFTDIKITGEGTNKIRVSFKPPVAQGITGAGIVAAGGALIHWLALHPFIVGMTVLFVGIIFVLVIWKIVFGKEAVGISKGVLLVAGLFAAGTIITAVAAKKKKP